MTYKYKKLSYIFLNDCKIKLRPNGSVLNTLNLKRIFFKKLKGSFPHLTEDESKPTRSFLDRRIRF